MNELRIRLTFREEPEQQRIYNILAPLTSRERNQVLRDALVQYYSESGGFSGQPPAPETKADDSSQSCSAVPPDILHRIQALENGVAELQDWRVSVDKEISDKQSAKQSMMQEQPKHTAAEPAPAAPSRVVRETTRVPAESVEPYVPPAYQDTVQEEAEPAGETISPAVLEYLNNLSM